MSLLAEHTCRRSVLGCWNTHTHTHTRTHAAGVERNVLVDAVKTWLKYLISAFPQHVTERVEEDVARLANAKPAVGIDETTIGQLVLVVTQWLAAPATRRNWPDLRAKLSSSIINFIVKACLSMPGKNVVDIDNHLTHHTILYLQKQQRVWPCTLPRWVRSRRIDSSPCAVRMAAHNRQSASCATQATSSTVRDNDTIAHWHLSCVYIKVPSRF